MTGLKNLRLVLAPLFALFLIASCSNQNGKERKSTAADLQHNSLSPRADNAKPSEMKPKKLIEVVSSLDQLNRIVEGTTEKLLIFDMYADWCRPCKMLAPTFASLANDHQENALFFRVNIDQNPDIASAFGVRGIPYVVFIKNKEAVHALTGLNPRESYEQVIKTCGNSETAATCREKLQITM